MQLKLPSVPAYSFPKSKRDRWGNDIAPGPGQYDEDKIGELSTHQNMPRATFNRAGLKSVSNLDNVPGPADYDSYKSSLSKRGQYVMSSTKRDIGMGGDGLPGPGSYETSISSLNKKGVSAIRTGRTLQSLESVPGPGNYETNKTTFSRRGVAALKGRGHDDLFNKQATPSPLDYDPYSYEKKYQNRGVKIPTSGRLNHLSDQTPGPAAYETSISTLNRKGYAVAKSGRNIFNKD